MRRMLVLTALVTIGGLSIAIAAQRSAGARPRAPIEVEKLADNLFVLTGGGGNTAVFITGGGVVLVDTKVQSFAAPLLAAVRTLSDKPIAIVINTHSHADHVMGQLEFPANIEYVSHENTKLSLEKSAEFAMPENAAKLPKRTFKDRLSLLAGNDRIDLYYFGRAHTGGDAWVVFPSVGVMHAGDVIAGKQIPLVDITFGGSGVSYPDTLANVFKGVKGVKTVITGHSTTMTWADVKEYVDFNRELLTWARAQMKAGKTPAQAAADYKLPARFAGYGAGTSALNFGGMPSYLNSVYTELNGK